jgi:hypothetical protein
LTNDKSDEKRLTVRKPGRASAARRDKTNWVRPIGIGQARINDSRRAGNNESLEVGAGGLILNNDSLAHAQKGQENINVDAVIGYMADVDLSSRCLSEVIPQNIAVARIARRSGGICLKQKQAG